MRIVGFFCDDVRAETAGTETVVGIIPDNINVPSEGVAFPRLAVYLRVIMEAKENPKTISASLHTPAGEKLPLGKADQSLIETAKKGARDNELPFAGIILRAQIAPFPIVKAGMFKVVCDVDGVEEVCAILNVKVTPSDSKQPSERAQPASLGT